MLSEQYKWDIIENNFKNNGFVKHQIDTFNDFLSSGVQRVVNECDIILPLYKVIFGDVFISTPTIIEEDRTVRPMLPCEARQRDLTYDAGIFVDIKEEITNENTNETEVFLHKRILVGRTPIMLNSDKCNLKHLTSRERINSGECEWDHGGYFIIKGKERVLVGQIRGIYNQPIVIQQKPSEKYKYICDVRSMSEETGHSVLLQVKIGYDDRTIVFSLPCIQEVIPVGIVFKALGFTEAKDIINIIGCFDEKFEKYMKYIIRDSFFIKTTEEALKYIGKFSMHTIKEDKQLDYAKQVVENELLPHMGVTSTIKEKAFFIGHMVNKLLCTSVGLRTEDDRDNYINKRIEMAGVLCSDLFRTLFKRFIKSIQIQLEKKKQRPDIVSIISRHTGITAGLRQSFATGNWGIQKNSYVRTGVSQVLSRLTYGATLSHLRRVVIPIGKEGKNAKIRQVHSSQFMYICPNEVPEGQSIGIVLNLSLLTYITRRIPTVLVKEIIEGCENLISVNDYNDVNTHTKVFLNGVIMGFTKDHSEMIEELSLFRKVGLLDRQISFTFDNNDNEIKIFSDEGRFIRPVLSVNNKTNKVNIKESDGTDWNELVEKQFIQYVDNSEIDNSVVAMTESDLDKFKCDFCEIQPSMMMGVMSNIIPFSDHNQAPRNIYQSSMG